MLTEAPAVIPTAIPTATPTTVPTSTPYIPEGFDSNYVFPTLAPLNLEITEPMFDEDYYLVLPGDGPQYFVYNRMGIVVSEFTYVGEFLWEAMGLYHRDTIVENFSLKKMDYVLESRDSGILGIDGAYFKIFSDGDGGICLTVIGSDHDPMFTLRAENTGYADFGRVFPYRGNYLIFLRGYDFSSGEVRFVMSPCIVDKRGNLVCKLDEEKFADIVGVIGDEYILTKNASQPGEEFRESMQCDVRKRNGEIILENVTALVSKTINVQDEIWKASIYCEYIVYDGCCYDSGLNQLSEIIAGDETWETPIMYGNFIRMYPYEVEGIICYADYEGFAYGSEGDRYAILSYWGEFVVTLPYDNLAAYYVSPNTAIFGDGEKRYLVSLETGEIVYETTERLEGTNSDICTFESEGGWITVDKNGVEHILYADRIRQVTYNGLFLIGRGAYIGLTTPDGEWLFRIVSPDVAADREGFYDYGWA